MPENDPESYVQGNHLRSAFEFIEIIVFAISHMAHIPIHGNKLVSQYIGYACQYCERKRSWEIGETFLAYKIHDELEGRAEMAGGTFLPERIPLRKILPETEKIPSPPENSQT